MACVDGFVKHRWSEDGATCLRCNTVNPRTESSTTAVDLSSLSDENKVQAQAPATRRPRRPSPEEQARNKVRRTNISKLIARIPHRVQQSIASMLYSYAGGAFELATEEETTLAECWLQVMDAFDFDPTSPWIALAVLAVTEIEISSRQWSAMMTDVARRTVEK